MVNDSWFYDRGFREWDWERDSEVGWREGAEERERGQGGTTLMQGRGGARGVKRQREREGGRDIETEREGGRG